MDTKQTDGYRIANRSTSRNIFINGHYITFFSICTIYQL